MSVTAEWVAVQVVLATAEWAAAMVEWVPPQVATAMAEWAARQLIFSVIWVVRNLSASMH